MTDREQFLRCLEWSTRFPKVYLVGDCQFLFDFSLHKNRKWQKAPLRKADFVFAFVSEPICSHTMAEIWTAIADGIPVYLFFEPGIDLELFWYCRRLAVQWMDFTTIHRNCLPELLKEVLSNWCWQ